MIITAYHEGGQTDGRMDGRTDRRTDSLLELAGFYPAAKNGFFVQTGCQITLEVVQKLHGPLQSVMGILYLETEIVFTKTKS